MRSGLSFAALRLSAAGVAVAALALTGALLWLHRDLPWDDWRLITTESDVGCSGRALTRRLVHARDGRLVATMAQEALIPDPPAGPAG